MNFSFEKSQLIMIFTPEKNVNLFHVNHAINSKSYYPIFFKK